MLPCWWFLKAGQRLCPFFLLIHTAKIVTCDFSVWALAESCPAGQRAGSTERRSESFPSRTATSGRASQATRSWSLEQGSHFNSFSPLLYWTLNCSLKYYLLFPLPRGLLISSVLLLVLGYESPVLQLEHIGILRCHQDDWIFIIFRAEIGLIWLAFGENFLLNGIYHFL